MLGAGGGCPASPPQGIGITSREWARNVSIKSLAPWSVLASGPGLARVCSLLAGGARLGGCLRLGRGKGELGHNLDTDRLAALKRCNHLLGAQ
jgi:hypothetical protein